MLETHRLMPWKWTPADAERLFSGMIKDPEVAPPAGWPPHRSIEESRSVIDTVFQAERYATLRKGQRSSPMGAVELMLGHTRDRPKARGNANWDTGPEPFGARAMCVPEAAGPC